VIIRLPVCCCADRWGTRSSVGDRALLQAD
jgi:hypothetical protein